MNQDFALRGASRHALPSRPVRVAVVDDDATTRSLLRGWFETAGYHVVEHASGKDAMAAEDGPLSAACVDLSLGDMSGLAVLRELQARQPSLPVILVTANRELEVAVGAMRAGACDYLTKPLEPGRTVAALDHAVQAGAARRKEARREPPVEPAPLLGPSEAAGTLREQVELLAASERPVWLYGEASTGRADIARALHAKSARAGGPCVCARPDGARDKPSELFGPDGAVARAGAGTLIVRDADALDAEEVARLASAALTGGPRCIFIAAAPPSPRDQAEALGVVVLRAPPLRERRDDLPALLRAHLERLEAGRRPHVEQAFLDALLAYGWPDNLREFDVALQSAFLGCHDGKLTIELLPASIRAGLAAREPAEVVPIRELESRAIEQALRACGGSVTRAAKSLGIGRATLYRRLAQLGLPPDSRPGATASRAGA